MLRGFSLRRCCSSRRLAGLALVLEPVALARDLHDVRVVHVESTEDMNAAVRAELPNADVLVMAAAPADFRPKNQATGKIKKATRPDSIALENTDDILATTRDARKKGAVIVGFALETDDVLAHAKEKLAAKALDMIVVNDARETGAGFGVDTNRVTILAPNIDAAVLPLLSKSETADAILDRIPELLNGR